MADKTIGDIVKQLEMIELSENRQNLPALPSIEVAPVIELAPVESSKAFGVKADTVQTAIPTSSSSTQLSSSNKTSLSAKVQQTVQKETFQIKQNDALSDAIQDALEDQTDDLVSAMEKNKSDSKVGDAIGFGLMGPVYGALKELKEAKNDPLVKWISGYFKQSEKKEKPASGIVEKKKTTTTLSSEFNHQAESSINSESSETTSDYSPILNKMDEIKEVLESDQKEELKLFKREERLERRRAGKLLRATKRSGKGGSDSGFLGNVVGKGLRGIMKVLPKIGAALSAFGSVIAGVAAPVAGVVSAIGGVALIGKDAFDMFKSWKEGGWENVKGRDVGGVAGGLGGAAVGAAIGTAIFPGVGTLIGAGLGAIAGNFLGEKGGKALEESPEEKAARIEKAEREEQQRKAQNAKEIADKARKERKNEDGFDYVDSWMKKQPSAAGAASAGKTAQSGKLIKEKKELISSRTVTATKNQRELTTTSKPTIKKKDDLAAQTKAVIMQKMSAQVQGSNAKKQLDTLIAEFKGLRKDMKKQIETPSEVQNPILRETIIQSKNLFR